MAMSKISVGFDADTRGLVAGAKSASTAIQKISREVKGLSTAMSLVKVDILSRGLASVARGFTGLTRSITSLGRDAFSGLASAVDQAVDLGEQLSKSQQIFGKSAEGVRKFAEGASKIGLSTKAALDATGTFGNLFVAMKLGSEQSAKYSTTMAQLAADLASFNNSTVEDAVGALGAALRGESEPIRRFGVLLDDATLRQVAFREGLVKTVKEALTPAVRAQAAYKAILEQTTKAQGDFARTSDSLANMKRIVGAQIENVFGDIGKGFEPFFAAVTSAFSEVLEEVGPLMRDIAASIAEDVTILANAIRQLVPNMRAFLKGLDGKAIGKGIGQAIIEAARTFGKIADVAIANFRAMYDLVGKITGVGVSEAEKRLNAMQAQLDAGLAPATGNIFLGEKPQIDPRFLEEFERLTKQVADERKAWDNFSVAKQIDDILQRAQAAMLAGDEDKNKEPPAAAVADEVAKVGNTFTQSFKTLADAVDVRSREGNQELLRLMYGSPGAVSEEVKELRRQTGVLDNIEKKISEPSEILMAVV